MWTILALVLWTLTTIIGSTTASAESIRWRSWDEVIFEEARSRQRFVLLDLEAVWCHWCHVMEETTYNDPRVVQLLKDAYIPVRVDQDANPDLSNRYGNWGWPATIIFAADGSELVKFRGYLPPDRMASMLKAVIDDPTPGPSVADPVTIIPAEMALLTEPQRKKLSDRFIGSFDANNGGWGSFHKFIDTDSMDFALIRSERGSAIFRDMARSTLDAARLLIDPEWGGVYQYSDQDDWRSPHYEKIMWYQAQYMRHYMHAFALWGNKEDLASARAIARYLLEFLTSPDGAFYTSQDADVDADFSGKKFYALTDAERRSLGRMPRIDKGIYARENGWAIQGLVALYSVSNDREILERATRAARWVLKNRSLTEGGFKHGESNRGGPFLGDTLAMGRAALDLYAATGTREWLRIASSAGDFISRSFKHPTGGFVTTKSAAARVGVFMEPVRSTEEQPRATRFFNLLFRYTGDHKYQQLSEHGLKYMAAKEFLDLGRPQPGLLLAEYEAAREPIHITIVGHKDSLRAQSLHEAARRFPAIYRRLDWWDKREGPPPNDDIIYPELEHPAAFACSNRICSLPIFSPDELRTSVEQIVRQPPRSSSRG